MLPTASASTKTATKVLIKIDVSTNLPILSGLYNKTNAILTTINAILLIN
ncbi:hypothetical protein DSM106972_042320 [Dulcicalothrix desertica PCC 7102]|uniref:Uncharacterized protein n=1 Tax=Dulcicalothrix desertica PCC 7102 TaxID=232991 RepID=A0A3S1CCU1_9CYAN|nr:hypothetical protein DSM106972_042320 [Dulcicalothrix desertica PCC 7102]